MLQSLLIKLAMLGVTLGSLIWIGSVTPIRQVTPHRIEPATAASIPVNARPERNDVSNERGRPVVGAEMPGGQETPFVEAAAPAAAAGGSDVKNSDQTPRVDLNQATASDLEALPGIGPRLAQRVIAHRTARGPFKRVEDLRQVKGIGRKKFDQIRPHVLVTNTRSPVRHKGIL